MVVACVVASSFFLCAVRFFSPFVFVHRRGLRKSLLFPPTHPASITHYSILRLLFPVDSHSCTHKQFKKNTLPPSPVESSAIRRGPGNRLIRTKVFYNFIYLLYFLAWESLISLWTSLFENKRSKAQTCDSSNLQIVFVRQWLSHVLLLLLSFFVLCDSSPLLYLCTKEVFASLCF